jgi:hypothetical protein
MQLNKKQVTMFFSNARIRFLRPTLVLLAATTSSLHLNAYAQAVQPSETRQWRNANTEVGRFTRGHIDLLKAERGRSVVLDSDKNALIGAFKEDTAAPELTQEVARKATLMAYPDVLASQAISPFEKASRDSQLLSLQQMTQKLWIEAVSAKEQLTISRRITDAASVALELATRMEKVGNWGRNKRIDIEISYLAARNQFLLADQTAFNTQQKLFAHVGSSAWRLPDALTKPVSLGTPDELLVPLDQQLAQILARHPQYSLLEKEAQYFERIVGPALLAQLQQEMVKMISATSSNTSIIPTLDRSKIIWNHDLEKAIKARSEVLRLNIKTKTDLHQAREHLRATHVQIIDVISNLQKLYSGAEDEALTRYNGMFISTWELISKAQAKMQSELAVAQSKRSFWIAFVDLQALLAGAPYSGPGGSATGVELSNPNGKGH